MKHPPKEFVILWVGKFYGNDYKVPEADTNKTLAELIPRSEVAILEVHVRHICFAGYYLYPETGEDIPEECRMASA
jgi:hypothetical protein